MLIPFCLLLVFPIAGYFWINNLTGLMEQSERNNLLSSARNITRTLEANPHLVNHLPDLTPLIGRRDLYSHKLNTDITLDGRKSDWGAFDTKAELYDKTNLVSIRYPYIPDSLTFEMLIGSDDTYLYTFLDIKDDVVVYREINNLSVHRNDHIAIALIDPEDTYRRYTIAVYQPSQTKAHVVTENGRSLRQENQISATWLATESGYNVEIKMPISMIGSHLAIAVADVDDPVKREIKFVMGSADPTDPAALGTILIPPVAVERFLSNLTPASIWLIDSHQRVITRTGDITIGTGLWQGAETSLFQTRIEFLDRFFQFKETSISKTFLTTRDNPGRDYISSALAGHPNTGAIKITDSFSDRLLDAGARKILIAAAPLYQGDKITAVIVRDQTNDVILAMRSEMISNMLMQSLLLIVVGIIFWLLFSFNITRRLSRLRLELESAVDSQGRVNRLVSTTDARDEIGDLRSSFSNVASRLQQYNQYLEAMASRLAHELRTPVSIVRSSLENLETNELTDDSMVYVQRAHEGVHRLTTILNNMSEATRLEQSLDDADIEMFDLAKLVRGCVSGYEQAFTDSAFSVSVEANTVMLSGIPDLIAQLLDKLVSNAVEFSTGQNPIKIRLTVDEGIAILRVINDGPGLPLEMRDKLFDSMVSVRASHDSSNSHLGLGLYIARIITDFHGGTISAADREDTEGVIVTVKIPLMRLSIKL